MAAAAVIAARHKRKLVEKTIKLTEKRLDSHVRNKFLKELKKTESFRFLVDIVEDEHAGKDPSRTILEEEQLPLIRPSFLSERHYIYMADYFKARFYDPELMMAYARGSTVGVYPETVKALVEAGEEPTGASVPEIDLESSGFAPKHILQFNECVFAFQVLAADEYYGNFIVFAIVVAGILVGVATYPALSDSAAVEGLDTTVQLIFTVDCFVKICAEGTRPLRYWIGPQWSWNNFDFWLVVICWLPPAVVGGNVAFLRLLRLMRLFKLVGKVKKLHVIVMGLAQGLTSVSYIVVLLVLVFFLFAVICVSTFRKNDPFLFGNIGIAMVTLYRVATMDNWTSLIYTNWFGCNSQFNGVLGSYHGRGRWEDVPLSRPLGRRNHMLETNFGDFFDNECWKPRGHPLAATIIFIAFVMLAAYIIMSLFIGAICGGMADALDAFDKEEEERAEAKALLLAKADPIGVMVSILKDYFDFVDDDGSNSIDELELARALRNVGKAVTVVEAKAIIAQCSDTGSLDFAQFVAVMSDGQVTPAEVSAKVQQERLHEFGPELTTLLRHAWAFDDEERREAIEEALKRPRLQRYLEVAERCRELMETSWFRKSNLMLIFAAATVVGIDTELSKPRHQQSYPALEGIDIAILVLFTLEVVIKIVAEGAHPLRYFKDNWNKFDFAIVFACDVFVLPVYPGAISLAMMVRLLRLLRVLKLLRELPQLRVIVDALIEGIGSISFIVLILFVFYYVYANIGIMLFRNNDPEHFGSLQMSLITLFRIATFDGWTDVLYTNMYGCTAWSYTYGRNKELFPEGKADKNRNNCNHPYAWGWIAVLYFISFCLFGSQVMLTLFVGVVSTSVEESRERQDRLEVIAKRTAARIEQLAIVPVPAGNPQLFYEIIFNILDEHEEGFVKSDAIKSLMPCLKHVQGGAINVGNFMKRTDLPKLLDVYALWDDKFSNPRIEFPEFIAILEFMRRSIVFPDTVPTLRQKYKATHKNRADSELTKAVASQLHAKVSTLAEDHPLRGLKDVDLGNAGVLQAACDATIAQLQSLCAALKPAEGAATGPNAAAARALMRELAEAVQAAGARLEGIDKKPEVKRRASVCFAKRLGVVLDERAESLGLPPRRHSLL